MSMALDVCNALNPRDGSPARGKADVVLGKALCVVIGALSGCSHGVIQHHQISALIIPNWVGGTSLSGASLSCGISAGVRSG
jgi:hypothetical protein